MAAELGALVRAIVQAIAADRRPNAALFVATAEQSGAEEDIQADDVVVYAQTTPKLGEAVVWSTKDGKPRFGRLKGAGKVQSGGKVQRPDKIRGVIVATITKEN